jgi:bifunctional non-homologous end joining protein LigD
LSEKKTNVLIEDRELALSNLDKVLYPKTGFTKGQVIDYYARIAPVMLTHLKGHPVTLKRYPHGVTGEFFYEKRCPTFRPSWIKTSASGPSKENVVHYCVVQDTASLIWIANLASIEIHTLLALEKNMQRPKSVVFDLDPGPGTGLLDCIDLALTMKKMFNHLKLQAFPKTSGGKGLHLSIPLNTAVDYEQTKQFARKMALILEEKFPQRVTSNMKKTLRQGKIFVDWSQNVEHKTTVCVYSLRAKEEPSVSTPVTWDELSDACKRKNASKLNFSPDAVLKRVQKNGDLFASVAKLKQRLPKL